ncbi:MAG: DUF223 domain-containing protein [Candidatus Symbiothrix sp.]|nr:DUF223 domain-containing protein [Candidatus Symbiothrix sp.]
MKKIFNVIVLLSFILIFAACSNEESVIDNQEVLSIQERYALTKQIAVYHSQGLDFAYNKLNDLRKAQGLNASEKFFRNISEQEQMAMINSIVSEFVSQEAVLSNLNEFDTKINFKRTADMSNNGILRSSDNDEDPLIKLFSFFDNVVDQTADTDLLKSLISNAISSEEFTLFSEVEQNELLALFAIFDDSSKYWSENGEKWNNLIDGESGVLRSSSVGDDNNIDPDMALSKVGKADAIGYFIGGLGGTIGGAITGAVGGAIAGGGVGAAPGAVVGGAVGGAAGAISKAVQDSWKAWLSGDGIAIPNLPSSYDLYSKSQDGI